MKWERDVWSKDAKDANICNPIETNFILFLINSWRDLEKHRRSMLGIFAD